MEDEAVEDDEDGEGDPVVADDQRSIEYGILQELDHAFSGTLFVRRRSIYKCSVVINFDSKNRTD